MKRTVFPPVAGDNQSKYGTTMFPPFVDETASIAYDGTLLPAGTASYAGISIDATKRYLKNSGKDKTPALVEAGQGKFFNGTSQYINTGIIPNASQGALVTRFTYASGAVSRWVYGTSEIGVWINASGKIECVFGNATYTITDILVADRSYHIEMPYIGLSAEVILDGVIKGTATATVFNPTLPMFVGARNASGTADRFFNSVIDETYYYDIALTDPQISTLYQYPEKIKVIYNVDDPTRYKIVPDIGNEDNCKLFLPMSESGNTAKDNRVVNVAVPLGIEQVTNGEFETTQYWVLGAGWSISNGKLSHTGTTASAVNQTYSPTVGKYYLCEVVVSYISGASSHIAFTGGTAVASNNFTLGRNRFILKALTGNINIYLGMSVDGDITIDSISIKEVSAYDITAFTASCVDSAKQLSYGAQCIAWKRDALGLPIGMSNGLSFDGGKSAKRIDIGYIPLSTVDFAISTIVRTQITQTNQNSGAKNFRWNVASNGASSGLYTGSWQATTGTLVVNTYNHLMLIRVGTTLYRYLNGVLKNTFTSLTWTSDTTSLMIGDDGFNGTPFYTIIGSIKVWKGVQVSKLVPSKELAKAQKIIAKLGA